MERRLRTLIACISGSEAIEGTLKSLAACTIPDGYEETVVVENGGPPVNRDLIESFDGALQIRYIHVFEKGKSNALNVALRQIDDGLVFFSDDDVRFHAEVLSAYAEAADTYGPGHFLGGPVDVDQERPPPEWLAPYLCPTARGCSWDDGREIDDSFTGFFGCNYAAFVTDLKQAGGFSPLKGPGSITGSTGQETDMQRRLVDGGATAKYVPRARVTHLVPQEKCTPEWALRRSYRSGAKDGMNYSREEPRDARLPPLWLVKAGMNQLFKLLVRFPWKAKRYHAEYWLLYHLGFMKGIWMTPGSQTSQQEYQVRADSDERAGLSGDVRVSDPLDDAA